MSDYDPLTYARSLVRSTPGIAKVETHRALPNEPSRRRQGDVRRNLFDGKISAVLRDDALGVALP